MVEFRNIWVLSMLTLICNSSTEAVLCKCRPNHCVLNQPDTDFFENVEHYCPSHRVSAQAVTIINVMETTLLSTTFSKFPNMTSLDMFRGRLARLDKETFGSAGNLSKLLMAWNNLTSLEDYVFKGADNLKDLTISSNPLKEISENTFANLHNLEILELSYNKLTSLPKKLFENNRLLKIITISENNIGFIDPETFNGLDALTRLDLQNNNLTTFDCKFLKASTVILDDNSLQHLVINEHYSTLRASRNNIQTITVEGVNVETLNLAHNRIRDIGNLTKLVKLTSLSLQSNTLEPNTVFSIFTALDDLMLQSTYINCTPETFRNLEMLRTLDLSYNNITEVDFTIFRSQFSLHALSYVGNRINSFNYLEAREHLPHLRMLYICKNGWNRTYYEQNIARMRKFGITHGLHHVSATFMPRDEYFNTCHEELDEDYNSDWYPEPLEDIDIEEDIDISEYDTNGLSNNVPVTDTTEPKKAASAFYITFQVLVYILSAVGLVLLVGVAFLWKKRHLMLRPTSNTEVADGVRLI